MTSVSLSAAYLNLCIGRAEDLMVEGKDPELILVSLLSLIMAPTQYKKVQ